MTDPRDRPYVAGLLVLTVATGVVDAVSYLALDQVFTGNMTGNVLFVGFAAAGAGGIPLLNNVVALVAFVLGAALCGCCSAGAPTTRGCRGARSACSPGSGARGRGRRAVARRRAPAHARGPGPHRRPRARDGRPGGRRAGRPRPGRLDRRRHHDAREPRPQQPARGRVREGAARRAGAVLAMGTGAAVGAVVVRSWSGAAGLLLAGLLVAVGTTTLALARRHDAVAPR